MKIPHTGKRAARRRWRPGARVVTIPLDLEVTAYFRVGEPGWQLRINEALRKAAGL